MTTSIRFRVVAFLTEDFSIIWAFSAFVKRYLTILFLFDTMKPSIRIFLQTGDHHES